MRCPGRARDELRQHFIEHILTASSRCPGGEGSGDTQRKIRVNWLRSPRQLLRNTRKESSASEITDGMPAPRTGQRPPSSKLARAYRGQAGDPDLWALLFKHFTKIKYTGTLEQTSLGMEASTLFQAFTFPKIFNFSMNCPFKTTEKYGK